MTTVKALERFGNVPGDKDVMTRTNQCLRNPLEKGGVGSNCEYRCHYSVSAPSASA